MRTSASVKWASPSMTRPRRKPSNARRWSTDHARLSTGTMARNAAAAMRASTRAARRAAPRASTCARSSTRVKERAGALDSSLSSTACTGPARGRSAGTGAGRGAARSLLTRGARWSRRSTPPWMGCVAAATQAPRRMGAMTKPSEYLAMPGHRRNMRAPPATFLRFGRSDDVVAGLETDVRRNVCGFERVIARLEIRPEARPRRVRVALGVLRRH